MSAASERALAEQIAATILASGLTVPDTSLAIDANTCRVDYLPRFEPAALTDLQIVVAPRSRSASPLSRTRTRRTVAAQIALLQSCQIGSDLFTALMDLTADIDDLLASAQNNPVYSAIPIVGTWLSSETSLYDVQTLEQHQVYRSVITATYWIPS